MSLLSWVILCVLGYFITDIFVSDPVLNKVIKVLTLVGLGVLLFLSVR